MALTKLTTVLNKISTLPTVIRDQASAVKAAFDHDVNVVKDYINDTLTVEIDNKDAQNVKLTGNQTVQGVKTYESSLIVPTPTTDMQASTKKYVDDMGTSKTGDLNAHKTSSDHDGRYYTETEIDGKVSTLNNADENLQSQITANTNGIADRYTKSELRSTTDSSSGADKIGVTPIPTFSGDSVQTVLESVKSRFDAIDQVNVNAEVASTHIGADGRTYASLPIRLDTVDSELASTAKQIDLDATNADVGINTNKITDLTAEVEALASGAPKPVTLASQMTDITKAYLYQGSEGGYSAGYIYYHNGSAWTIGQEYLAPDISANVKSVTNSYLGVETITNKLSNGNFANTTGWSATPDYNAASSLSATNNTLSVTGTSTLRVGARSGTGIFEINKKYYVKIYARVTNSNCAIMQLKQGDIQLAKEIVSPVQNQWYLMDAIINVTSAVHTFLYFFHQYADASTANGKVMEVQFACVVDLTTNFGSLNIPSLAYMRNIMDRYDNSWFDGTVSLFQCDDVLNRTKSLEDSAVTGTTSVASDVFTDKTTVLNTNINYLTGAAVTNTSFVATNYIEVEASTTYKVNRNDNMYSQTGNMAFYDENKAYISGQQSFYENWTTPANAKYVRFCVYYGDYTSANFTFANMTIVKGSTFIPASSDKTVSSTRVYDSLYGKKWLCIGDSITEVNNRAYLHYHDYIKQELGLTVVNAGVSGTGYKKRDNESLAIYQRIATVGFTSDADIITIFAGINDALFETASIGAATDTGTDTWCGCVNQAITNLQAIYTHVPLGIISPLPCSWTGVSSYPVQLPSDLTSRASLFVDKLAEICKLRGVPFLDLFHTSNFRPDNAAWVAKYTSCGDSRNGDGLHPNSHGHKLIYRKIMQFVKTLAA